MRHSVVLGVLMLGALTARSAPSLAQTVLPRAGWVATASTTTSGEPASRAIDGSSSTRWSTGTEQTAGQWFSIDMISPQTFSQITIDPAGSTNDWTRGYQVFVSNDAVDWGAPIASGTGSTGILTIMFPTQTARFVGIVQTASGSNWWSIGEINVYGPGAVPTVALSSAGWVASASVTGGSDVPARAIDGNLATRWSTGVAQSNGQFFQLDMLAQRTIAKLTMNTDGSSSDFPRSYQVFVSDNTSNWGAPVASGVGGSSLTVVQFAPSSGRYLKIALTGAASNWWSIAELTVYGVGTFDPVAMALPRMGWTATASVSCSSDTPAKALDDNPSTRFSTCQNQTNGQTFQVDMLTARSFTKITLDAGTSSSDYPRGYQVYVTNDTQNWGSAIASGAGAAPLVTITFPFRTARYIKVVQTATSTNWWSIHEFNVYGIQPYLLLRDGWVATASANSSSAGNGIDGRLSTRWTTGTPQVGGQWYQLDMLVPQSFSQITLDADGASSDYPRGYQVFSSNSPTTWGAPVATGVGSASLVSIGFPTQLARYVRIVQTGSATNWWSIAEINVWNSGVAPIEPIVVPSPAGRLRCSLLNGSVVTLGGSQSAAVTGDIDLSISPGGAVSLDRLNARAPSLCSGAQCSVLDLQASPLVLSLGTMTPADGTLTMSMTSRLVFADLTSAPSDTSLVFQGHLQHRKVVGLATGTMPANAVLFPGASIALTVVCGEEEPNQIVEADFTINASSIVSATGITVRPGRSPIVRRDGGSFVAQALDAQNVVVYQTSFADPRQLFDGSALDSASFSVRIPFANGIRTLSLLTPFSPTPLSIDLAAAASAFCTTRPDNPDCRKLADPNGIEETTLALSSVPPGTSVLNAPRAVTGQIDVAAPPNTVGVFPRDRSPAVAGSPSGVILVAWLRDDPQKKDVRSRVFDNNGVPLSADVGLVADGAAGEGVQVAGGSSGAFVVGWEETSLATLTTSLVVQRLDVAGNRVGAPIAVAASDAGKVVTDLRLTMDGLGRFTAFWTELQPPPSGVLHLVMRRFAADGTVDGGVITVSTTFNGVAHTIASDDIGRIVVANTESASGSPNGNLVVRRFNQSRQAVGNPIVKLLTQVLPKDQLAIAMSPDSGAFVFIRGDGVHFYSDNYDVNGVLVPGDFAVGEFDIRVDAKDDGHRGAVSAARRAGGGEMFTAWSSFATTNNVDQLRVTAQDFDGAMLPMDIDFDIGQSRRQVVPVGDQGSEPAPKVAVAGDRFATVWEGVGGVRLQVLRSGGYACPLHANCRESVPIMVNGDAMTTFNLQLVRGQGPHDPILSSMGPRTYVWTEAVHRIVNGLFGVPAVEDNRRRYNVFYLVDPTNRFSRVLEDADSTGTADTFVAGASDPSGQTFDYDAFDLGQFRHEGGHALFALADEYPCAGEGTLRFEPANHGNLFSALDHCEARSENPSGCLILSGAPGQCTPVGPWAKSDPDDDIMVASHGDHPYGLDCLAQITQIVNKIPCPGGALGSCR